MKTALLFGLLWMPLLGRSQSRPVVIAHRGDHTAAPEGSLKAFENAIALGVDYVEVDLRTSADGQLIVMHDALVDRTTDGHGAVRDLALDSLKRLKISNKSHPEFGAEPIPTFAEVLERCRNRVGVYLDFKDADAGQAWGAIQQAGMEKALVVYVNDSAQFRAWRAVAPAVPLLVSLPKSVRDVPTLQVFLDTCNAEILDGPYTAYTPELVREAVRRGRRVWADAQHPAEGPTDWGRALAAGLHGLQTDHPASLIQFLKQNQLR